MQLFMSGGDHLTSGEPHARYSLKLKKNKNEKMRLASWPDRQTAFLLMNIKYKLVYTYINKHISIFTGNGIDHQWLKTDKYSSFHPYI